MKKFLLRLLVFSLVALIALFCVVGAAGVLFPETFRGSIKDKRGDVGHLFSRLREVKTKGPVDILVIGSSHAYRGFDPRFFERRGQTIFVLGSSAQTPIQTEILVKRYIDRLKPRTVVVEVFPGVFCIDGVESSIDLISNGDIRPDLVCMAMRINNLITYNSLLFHSFRRLVFGNRFNEPECRNGECYISGGFVERTETEVFKGRKKGQPISWLMRDDQKRAFARIITFLKKRDCRTVLLQAPVVRPFYETYDNNAAVDAWFKSFGLEYYNYNQTFISDSNHFFYDQDHLNRTGVKHFNKLVYRTLEGKYKPGSGETPGI